MLENENVLGLLQEIMVKVRDYKIHLKELFP